MVAVIARNVLVARRGYEPHQQERAEADPRYRPFEPDEPSDLEDPLTPWPDDDRWEVFLPDENEPYEAVPEPGDFWIDGDGEFGD